MGNNEENFDNIRKKERKKKREREIKKVGLRFEDKKEKVEELKRAWDLRSHMLGLWAIIAFQILHNY